MVYEWKHGIGYGVSAQVVGEVCEQLESRNNLNAQALVDVSKPTDAPTHSLFEWDNDVAADEYRKHQARMVINHLVIAPKVEQRSEPVRAFFTVQSLAGNYANVGAIIKVQSTRDELLAQAKRELNAFANKYSQLTELSKVVNAIKELA